MYRLLGGALDKIRNMGVMVVDEDVAKAYNLVVPKWDSSVIVFLGGVSRGFRDTRTRVM